MSSDELSVRVDRLSKRYEIYTQPADRLKQMILPRVQRATHRAARKYFHEFWALRDVSFDVRRGETVGIVGRNGSGKSTLLQLVCGTLTPTSGSVSVDGRIAALLELGAGFNPEFTGKENVRLSGLLYGLSDEELHERYQSILDFAEIGDFIDQPVKTYSSGMYVRLAFAVAINVSPDVLVIDEALAVGDEAFQRKCYAKIQTIKEAGAAVLFVSHSAASVVELCDRAVLLDGGEMIAVAAPKFIVSRYHKLLYSPAGRVELVREQIRSDALKYSTDGPLSGHSDQRDTPVARKVAMVQAPPQRDYFDDGMVPKSSVRYSNRGAYIEDAHLESLDGRRVNVLCGGLAYVYTYRVRYESNATRVRYGMMIKTITGMELGGGASNTQFAAEDDCAAGAIAIVRFGFRCLLAPGVYFLNAGVLGNVDGEEQYLDRYLDVAMFRVLPDPDRLATGTVDFEVTPRISYCAAAIAR